MDKDKLGIFAKIPTLETERLILRRMKPSDSEDMFEYASRPEVSEYLLWLPHTTQRFTKNYLHFLQTQYMTKNFYDWAVTIKSTGSAPAASLPLTLQTIPPRSVMSSAAAIGGSALLRKH